MKILNYIFVFLVIISFLTSCQRENIDSEVLKISNIDIDTIYQGTPVIYVHFVSSCYDFVYPVTAILDDGTTSVALCKADLENLIENNLVTGYQYPLQVTDVFGIDTTLINNLEELEDEDCKGGASYFVGVKEYCHCDKVFLVYPVDIIDQDGTKTTVADYPELLAAYEAWYPSSDPFDDFLDFVYPIQCIDIDGTETEVNNASELTFLVNEICY